MQSRSTALNTKLENRKTVEKLLRPAVEEISISPDIVRKISEDAIDESWIKALEQIEKRSSIIEGNVKSKINIRAVEGVKPLLDDLTKKVSMRGTSLLKFDR